MHYIPGQTRTQGDPDSAGAFEERPAPLARDFHARAFTVGIGGPVGSGKTALLLALCRALRDDNNIAVVTNDIFTREDAEFLTRHQALAPERIAAVETGGCPNTAVRDDISQNLDALQQLMSDPRRRFWRADEFRHAVESLSPEEYRRLRYYERWIAAVTRLLVAKGVLTREEIEQRISQLRK